MKVGLGNLTGVGLSNLTGVGLGNMRMSQSKRIGSQNICNLYSLINIHGISHGLILFKYFFPKEAPNHL